MPMGRMLIDFGPEAEIPSLLHMLNKKWSKTQENVSHWLKYQQISKFQQIHAYSIHKEYAKHTHTHTQKKKLYTDKVYCMEAHPFRGALSQQGLNPIELAYDQCQPLTKYISMPALLIKCTQADINHILVVSD